MGGPENPSNAPFDLAALFERSIPSESGTTLDASDGRVANRLRNRAKVIDAFVDLVREGRPGTVDEIAERSGVARRSIFRYFNDLSDLALEGFRRVLSDSAPHAVIAEIGIGPLDQRVDRLVRARVVSLDLTYPFALIARQRLAHVEEVGRAINVTMDIARTQIAKHFAPELTEVDDDIAQRRIDAVLALTSFGSYSLLSRQRGLDHDEVIETWSGAITAIVAV